MWDNLACVLAIHQRQQLQSLFKVKLVFDVFQNFYGLTINRITVESKLYCHRSATKIKKSVWSHGIWLGWKENGICCLVISLAILALFMR